jgi:hypothetical protein
MAVVLDVALEANFFQEANAPIRPNAGFHEFLRIGGRRWVIPPSEPWGERPQKRLDSRNFLSNSLRKLVSDRN